MAGKAREAAAILTVSEFSKKEIIHFTGVEESKIFVTPIASQQPQDGVHGHRQAGAVSRNGKGLAGKDDEGELPPPHGSGARQIA